MDDTTFDALSKRFADPRTRRTTLRLLAGGVLGALLPALSTRAQEPMCTAVGAACSSNTCCQADPNYTYVQCCFDANGAGVCTDVAASGTFHCPDPGVPTSGCSAGQADCGGFCTDLLTDPGNCGYCGHQCKEAGGPDYNCVDGYCVFYCLPGLVDCGGYCTDVQSDFRNCGACFHHCGVSEFGLGECNGGECWYPTRLEAPSSASSI